MEHTERRGLDGMALQVMAEVREIIEGHETREGATFKNMKEEIQQNRKESDARHCELLERFEGMQNSTTKLLEANQTTVNEIHKMFKKAFPEGDVDAHRKAHEYLMEKDKEDKEFWLKLKQNVVTWVAIAAIGWGGIVIWAAFLKGPGA